jgi:hypothetical protein
LWLTRSARTWWSATKDIKVDGIEIATEDDRRDLPPQS